MKKIISLLLVLATILTMTACGQESPATGTTGVTSPNATTPTEPEVLSEVYNIDCYTGTTEELLANLETVVAALGGVPLKNRTLQIFYWMDVYDFVNNADVDSYGLNPDAPLADQELTPGTWQQYFLGSALGSWNYHQALALVAEEEGITLLPYFQAQLDNMDQELEESAKEGEHESVDIMIQKDTSPGCNAEDYRTYRQIIYAAQNYCYVKINAMTFTDEQIEDYFTEYQASLAVEGITKDLGDSHRVRHILVPMDIQEATDEDWENLRQQAQDILDQWLAGDATEDSFAALAMEKSEDPGSVNYGGLYQGLTADTSFLTEYKNWYMDESRQPGDYGLVKTTAGYHVMYYSGSEPIWYYYCREMLVSEEIAKIENAALKKYEAEIYYDKILLNDNSPSEDK